MVWQHIRENAKEKGIFIDFVNGYNAHCHCVVSLGVDQTIQKTIQLIKGESSFWVNKNSELFPSLYGKKFGRQDEYFAVSISESMIGFSQNLYALHTIFKPIPIKGLFLLALAKIFMHFKTYPY